MIKGVATREPTVACPRCGSPTVAKILYGYPAFSQKLQADLDAGRVVLGGCVVWEGRPDHACTSCRFEFRTDGVVPVAHKWQ
jgi:hypothetical protein